MSEETTEEKQFAVIAEVEGSSKQLVLLNLSFGRLLDEIVVPYDQGDLFFIDGVPVSKEKIKRIKIVECGASYRRAIFDLERGMTRGDARNQKVYGDQYDVRFEHILRAKTNDVTSQIIKAYNQEIKPSIKDYLPKRGELISAAVKVFIESMKQLGS